MNTEKYDDLYQQAKNHRERLEINQQFFLELKEELGIVNHPKADNLIQIAWEHCHSDGLNDVVCFAWDLKELLAVYNHMSPAVR